MPSRQTRPRRRVGKPLFPLVILLLVILFGLFGLFKYHNYLSAGKADEQNQSNTSPLRPAYSQGVELNSYKAENFIKSGDIISYTEGQFSALQGIDVSEHNGLIDWAAVAADGIDFAMIRVGYRGYLAGNLAYDAMYLENLMGALENGIDVGVYFFSQALTVEEAIEEAAFTMDTIMEFDIKYPVAFDWEPIAHSDAARTKGATSEMITACAAAFSSYVRDSGYSPLIYFNQLYGYTEFILPDLEEYDFWLAQYSDYPGFHYNFQMWQYTDSGSVSGISASVDRNICFKAYD